MDKIEKLQEMIDNSNNIAFFSGAGVSTDSGLKDFRSKNGMYSVKSKYPAEYMLSSEMFYQHPQEFYDYYKENFNCLDKEPNITHLYLKKLEDKGKLKGIVTQNIDGLHTKAGSKNFYEIHGTIYKNSCLKCGKSYGPEKVFQTNGVPMCSCGGIIKPNVVLYGETLPACFTEAQRLIMEADLLIVAGTSLVVEPASSMIRLFQGKNLVILNLSPTPYDKMATLVIHDELKNIFSKLK